MPDYLTRKGHTYYFRQAVPGELRAILGRREIKKSLGRDYRQAVQACKRLAVEADRRLAEARAQRDQIAIDPYTPEGYRRTQPVPLDRLTPELEVQFTGYLRAALLEGDERRRVAGLTPTEFDAYGHEIDAAILALRRQLARGDVLPLIPGAQAILIGRGYAPRFSEDDWRRLGYLAAQASLEAYEGLAARQAGHLVKAPDSPRLASQYELQNTPDSPAARLAWDDLYRVWDAECERRQNTRAAYAAALRLFQGFCPKSPEAVTRSDALAYRDHLLKDHGHAPGTVANKLGFLGTLINAGRNHSAHANRLTHNPFENIKVKEGKRGKAGGKRLPFADADLRRIFDAPIYTAGQRPRGGGGEAAAWIPAIAYLTGMRLEEIALLHSRQFHSDARGHPYIHTEDGKNANSADRDIPIHPMLIDAGLLEYARACQGRLFPKIACRNEIQSKTFSQWFGRHLDSLGLTSKSLVFHSFRHLFKDLCRNAGMDDSAIDQICGHEPGTVGGRYGSGRRIDVLAELIARIVPPVAVPRIYPSSGKPATT